MKLFLIRHPEDEQDKIGGWSNNLLTDEGIKQSHALALKLRDIGVDVVICSDLKRCAECGKIIKKYLNVQLIISSDFRDFNNGVLKNLTDNEFLEKYPTLYFANLEYEQHYPQGESPKELYERISLKYREIVTKYKQKKVAIITHGAVISVIESLINKKSWTNKEVKNYKYAEINEYKVEE